MADAISRVIPELKLTDFMKQLNSGNVSLNKTHVSLNIKNNYESIFSWEIDETIRKFNMKDADFLWKIHQKMDLVQNKNCKFNFDLFCLNLISSFELFSHFEYTQALNKVKDIISTLKCTQMDPFFEQISDACFHIAYATQAYIMVNLDNGVHKILSNIKSKSDFNKVEKAAIYGIKSKIFLEYSPEGNDEAFKYIESARNFNDSEMMWIHIWLKAKRRIRRFTLDPSFPFRDELEAAHKLAFSINLEFLTSAASVYVEAGKVLNLIRSHTNVRESSLHFKAAADLILTVYYSAYNDIKLLYHCLSCINHLPFNLIPKSVTNQIVNTLIHHENYRIQNVLGKYFLRNKNFKKARDYFKKSSRAFSSSLLLIKVECILSSVDDFPVVQYLRLLYASCTGSKKKRSISTQILLYYLYNENENKKELLYCLDTYLNDHIDFVRKKNYTHTIVPLFQLKKRFIQKSFINDVKNSIEQLKTYSSWNVTEKNILNKIVSKFSIISNSDQIDEFIDPDLACVVCTSHKACYVLRPCGHQCVCKPCWTSLKTHSNLCPICRAVVSHYIICAR